MARKKILSLALATLMTVSTLFETSASYINVIQAKANEESKIQEEEVQEVVLDAEQVDASDYGLCETTKEGSILHAFCWSFNSIKENMKDIAEAGYTTVQTSPINECLVGEGGGMQLFGNGKWYYHYQPTDWKIGNYQLGSRDDYKAMCAEADKYGVKIISDVLPNHTTPTLDAVSSELANAAGGKSAGALYHSNGFNEIKNYKDRYECTLGQMGGLPDVNTENQGFQKYYLQFCNDVIDCGGDGFRYDTAKHIGVASDPKDASNSRGVNDFWDVATGKKEVNGVKLNRPDNFFIYGEVLQDEGIPYGEYASYMEMTASSYGHVLRENLGKSSLGTGSVSNWCHDTPDKIVTWVESHDTYCNQHESAWMNDFQIRAGWAIIAGRSKGTPLFFSRPAGSNGSSGNIWGNNLIGAAGNDQFKHPEVAACNHFRNAMVGESEYLSNPNGNSSVLVIERGTKGAIIINMGSGTSNVPLNKVADGTYTEHVSGKEVQVSGGKLNCEVPGGSIAVVFNAGPVTKNPTVSVSKDSGNFTEAFELTLTPSNATKATYSINGGDAVEFTKKTTVTIGEDCSVGDKVTVKVTAEGDGEPFSKTYTYTMADAPSIPEAKLYIRTKASDYTSAPSIYLYGGEGESATKYAGEWPGTTMTKDGDYYVFYTNDTSSAKAIFMCNGEQDPGAQQPGYDVSGYMEYSRSAKSVTKFTPQTSKPTTKPTTKPTVEPTVKPTPEPVEDGVIIEASKKDGESFTTETMDVKLTLDGAKEGTYVLDDGPEKNFKSGDTVKIGQGKIADSKITLKVTAGTGSDKKTKTFTYEKVFDPSTAEVKSSAITRIQSLFEVVEEAAQTNASAETGGMYATNPGGNVGKEATITIDGSFSDWSEDMLIAQCGAWDIANCWKGAHENCVLDSYALYAAWDDTNLYLGWQMVNTTDTWAKQGDGPLSDGGRVLDVPLVLALNVGNRHAMTGQMSNGKLIWDALDLSFETRVDNLLLMSGKVGLGTPGYFIAENESGGASYDPGYCLSFKDEGISYKMAEGCLPKSIMGLEGSQSVDDAYDASAYKDMMSAGHDTTYDSFYEINIPLETLGIDKAYLTEKGIGVMQISTRGASGIDCIPHDPSMLDNVTGDCAVDPFTSHEKDDADVITVPLAAVGNISGSSNEGGVIENPTKQTASPSKSEKPEETTKPSESSKVEATKKPDIDDSVYTVNFGADRCSPQLKDTALTLKAVAYGGSKDYKYEFYVDGEVVQKSSTKDSYKWEGKAGEHTIKVVVEDSEGKKLTSEKKYVLEGEIEETKAPEETEVPQETKAPEETPKQTPKATVAPAEKTPTPGLSVGDEDSNESALDSNIKITVQTDNYKTRKEIAGKKVRFVVSATGGAGSYTYRLTATNSKGKKVNCKGTEKSGSVLFNWTTAKADTYTIDITVTDAKNKYNTTSFNYKITTPIKVKKFNASKTKIKKGKTITFKVKATSLDTVKYRFRVQKIGTSKITVVRKYAKNATYKWKGSKKGKYYIYLDVKDADGNKKTVKKKVTVK